MRCSGLNKIINKKTDVKQPKFEVTVHGDDICDGVNDIWFLLRHTFVPQSI
jgi:hypothetical protein